MSVIDPDLVALLQSQFQAGADGFACQGTYGELNPLPNIRHISIEKSRQADAATFEIECDAGESVLLAKPGDGVTIDQWYGSLTHVTTMDGVIDKIDDSRAVTDRLITITGRDRMAFLLDPYVFIAIAPQGADEAGAVRDSTNGVYLNMEVSAIVNDILDKAGWDLHRDIYPTSYLVDEYVIPDGTEFASALSELRQLVGFDHGCRGVTYRFAPPWDVDYDDARNPVPVCTVESGKDMISLSKATDWYDMRTRVRVTGTFTALQDAWQQTWVTNIVPAPTGLWYKGDDPGVVRVLSGTTKKVYAIFRSDRTIATVTGAIAGTYYPAGLSGDPSDGSIYWVLDAPWRVSSGVASRILKVRFSDNVIVGTFTLNSNHWSDLKVDGSNIWLANLTTGLFHTRSKVDGSAVATYGPNYTGAVTATRTDPSGIAIDGTTGYLFFAGIAQMYVVDLGAPTVVIKTISTAGTGMIGGEVDTTTHTSMFACSDNTGQTWEYALAVGVDASVSVVAIATTAGASIVTPEPTTQRGDLEGSPNGYGIRRYTLALGVITSAAQASVTALADLAKKSHPRVIRDIGIIADPALEMGHLIEVIDLVTGTDELGIVDTYRTDMAASGSGATYVATVAHIPWTDVTP